MTRLRKLLEAATKGPWRACREGECSCGMIWSKATDSHIVTAHDEWGDGPDAIYGANGKEAQRGNAQLIVAAVNALPGLLDIAEAAQRWKDAREALSRPDGVNAAEEYFSAAAALTAALAQWEKRNG